MWLNVLIAPALLLVIVIMAATVQRRENALVILATVRIGTGEPVDGRERLPILWIQRTRAIFSGSGCHCQQPGQQL